MWNITKTDLGLYEHPTDSSRVEALLSKRMVQEAIDRKNAETKFERVKVFRLSDSIKRRHL